MDAVTQYALAYALTTTAGIRGLLTLAVVSFAAHVGWLHPPAGFAWLSSTPALVVLIVIAAVDFVGDKIPMVDHGLHVVHAIVKPAAGAILVGSVVHAPSQVDLVGLMALGALNAFGVHAASATARGASTALTAGVANPFVSFFEDVTTVVMLVIAWATPILAAAIAIVLSVVVVRYAHQAFRQAAT